MAYCPKCEKEFKAGVWHRTFRNSLKSYSYRRCPECDTEVEAVKKKQPTRKEIRAKAVADTKAAIIEKLSTDVQGWVVETHSCGCEFVVISSEVLDVIQNTEVD